MSRKIIGVTVATPISPSKIENEIKPVKTVNGVEPDENGNVEVSGGSGVIGENGATFIPSVSADGVLSWTNDKGLDNPESVNIKGADGKDGKDGYNGFSPTVIVTKSGKETEIYINDANGLQSATILDGADGKDGEDGTSPTIGTATITDGHRISITDKTGTKHFDVMDGKDGKDGTNGKDYVLTEADKADIASRTAILLKENGVIGVVDENNNIIVSGNLADGTYTVKYEMEDGSTVDIGDLVLDTNEYCTITNNLTNCTTNNMQSETVKNSGYVATITANSGYELKSLVVTMGGTDITSSAVSGGNINIGVVTGDIVITAVAEEIKAAYTNILTSGKYTVELNKRWSGSSKAFTTCNGMFGILIPMADVLNKTIRFKGFTPDLLASNQNPMWMVLDTSKVELDKLNDGVDGANDGKLWKSGYLQTNGDVYSIPINSTTFHYTDTAAYLVINMAVNASTAITILPDNLIMTIDEDIV